MEQFVAIDNYGEGKKSRAFRLMKNGNNTGIFTKINDVNIQQNEQDNEFNNIQIDNINQNNEEINGI